MITADARRVFLAFEGGGAKGIVHIGALRALEEQDIRIAGAAGTSAGAIVASLVAAGYRSRDLIADDGSSPILKDIGLMRATDFFGSNWSRLALARWACSHPVIALLIVSLPCVLGAGLCVLLFDIGIACAILIFISLMAVLAIVLLNFLARGLAHLDLLVEKLELAFSMKLGIPKGQPVFFSDFDKGGRPLRVIATDLAARRLMLFSSTETPRVRVAEAVAASAALPIACRHRMVADRKFIDGGIVSNLPAWTFDEERALDPDAVTVAISIDDGRGGRDGLNAGPLQIAISIMSAAMFGRRHLETRAAPRLLTLDLKTDVRVIDFDMGKDRARRAVEDAERAAIARISERLFKLPKRFEEACELVARQVDAQAKTSLPMDSRTRVLVALRDQGASNSWRIQFGSGLLPTDTDDQILLPENASVIGHAVLREAPILQAQPFGNEVALSGPKNRYRKALLRQDLKWCFAIPIYEEDRENADPVAVVAIDSNVDVSYFRFDEATVDVLSKAAIALVLPVVRSALSVE